MYTAQRTSEALFCGRRGIVIANISFVILETKWLIILMQPMGKYTCCGAVLDSQNICFQSLICSPSCRNIKIIDFGQMLLFNKHVSYGVAFSGIFLSTIICIFNDACQELIILATIGKVEWRKMEARILETMYSAQTLLNLVEVRRRASTVYLFYHKCFCHPSSYNVFILSS